MSLHSIATLVYIGLLLIYGVITAAIMYHLHRYFVPGDKTRLMGVVYFIVSGVLIGLSLFFFLTIEWGLIGPLVR